MKMNDQIVQLRCLFILEIINIPIYRDRANGLMLNSNPSHSSSFMIIINSLMMMTMIMMIIIILVKLTILRVRCVTLTQRQAAVGAAFECFL